jgi:tRNA G18 (ribose-2'-O)-methylase SpoU
VQRKLVPSAQHGGERHPLFVTSRDNPLLKELRKVAHDNTAYRKAGRFWVEGDHLCSAALAARRITCRRRLF